MSANTIEILSVLDIIAHESIIWHLFGTRRTLCFLLKAKSHCGLVRNAGLIISWSWCVPLYRAFSPAEPTRCITLQFMFLLAYPGVSFPTLSCGYDLTYIQCNLTNCIMHFEMKRIGRFMLLMRLCRVLCMQRTL